MTVKELFLEEILADSPLFDAHSKVDRVQTAHRVKLVEFWQPKEGSRILEIGCGQGATTIVLAHAVGANGWIQGVDTASGDYRTPLTMREAKVHLAASGIGAWTQIDYDTDVRAESISFERNEFDWVILSLSSWYFASSSDLTSVLERVRPWSSRLGFAEWDPRPRETGQFAHALAAVMWSQLSSLMEHSEANIRTLMSREQVRTIVEAAGWRVEEEAWMCTPGMQDAKWETDSVLHEAESELPKMSDVPSRLAEVLMSQASMLREVISAYGTQSLGTYAFAAA